MKKDDMRSDSAEPTDSSVEHGTLAAVGELMEERKRYEGWIASLETRRATTPDRVFTRVHADYTGRLDAVITRLTTYAAALRDEIALLSNRLAELLDERQIAEDERAEAEVRALVGELSAEDWEKTSAESGARLSELGDRHGALEQELSRTQEMLDAAERPPSGGPPGIKLETAEETAEKPEPVAPTQASSEAPAAEVSPAPAAPEQQVLGIEEAPTPAVAAAPPLAAAAGRSSTAAPRQSSSIPRPSVVTSSPEPAARTSKFDELAFLSSVVDTPSGAFEAGPTDQPDEKERLESFSRRSQEDAVVNLTESGNVPLIRPTIGFQKEGDALLGDAVGKAAISGRHTAADGAKSLKCAECSAMNYPTEWYCERCGAELASL